MEEFKLKLEGEGLLLERPVPADVARRVLVLVLGGTPSAGIGEKLVEESVVSTGEEVPSPKQFMAAKRPANDTERLVCLAYYLTHFRSMPQFKTKDLSLLSREAAQPRFSNPSVTARNATNYQYLSLAGSGAKQITARGEELVKALPDRPKVKEALEKFPLPKRGRRKNKKEPG
jgi:hypothetical protein